MRRALPALRAVHQAAGELPAPGGAGSRPSPRPGSSGAGPGGQCRNSFLASQRFPAAAPAAAAALARKRACRGQPPAGDQQRCSARNQRLAWWQRTADGAQARASVRGRLKRELQRARASCRRHQCCLGRWREAGSSHAALGPAARRGAADPAHPGSGSGVKHRRRSCRLQTQRRTAEQRGGDRPDRPSRSCHARQQAAPSAEPARRPSRWPLHPPGRAAPGADARPTPADAGAESSAAAAAGAQRHASTFTFASLTDAPAAPTGGPISISVKESKGKVDVTVSAGSASAK